MIDANVKAIKGDESRVGFFCIVHGVVSLGLGYQRGYPLVVMAFNLSLGLAADFHLQYTTFFRDGKGINT